MGIATIYSAVSPPDLFNHNHHGLVATTSSLPEIRGKGKGKDYGLTLLDAGSELAGSSLKLEPFISGRQQGPRNIWVQVTNLNPLKDAQNDG